jgi:hypothetical protein
MTAGYYTAHIDKLLKDFERTCRWFRPHLVIRSGQASAEAILRAAREEYARLIPHIPYIGGAKVHMTSDLMEAIQLLAILRALKSSGMTFVESQEIVFKGVQTRLSGYPRWLLKLAGWRAFSKPFLHYLQRQSKASQQRQYPDGFVFEVVKGDGHEFDWGLNLTECGICKFYQAQNATEFLPLVCPVDFALSDALGYGLVRTQTLAEGADYCDPRLKRGRPTQWRLPAASN